MPVIVSPNFSSIKIKYDCGSDLNGDTIYKTKTYSNIKASASNDDVMAVTNAIVSLQSNTSAAVNRVDNSSLSE